MELKTFCAGIVLCHNHSSNNLRPSEADIRLTKSLGDAGKLLNIEVLDHFIISRYGYYSFKDEGMM